MKVALIVLSFFSLLVWFTMPIYPDEIAVRLTSGRYFQDGGIAQKLFHICSANSHETPILFVFPALVLSGLDLFFSPASTRIFPLIITLAAISLTIFLSMRKGFPYAAIVATTGLLGVAGSGLILARYEYMQVLNVAFCLGAIYFVESDSQRPSVRYGLLIALMLSILLSLYVHIQGLIFLPLTLFLIHQLLYPVAGITRSAVLLTALLLVATYTSIDFHKISCSDHPQIEQYLADMVFNWGKFNSLGTGEWFGLELKKYYLSFLYKENYQIGYLPGIVAANQLQKSLLDLLNLGIVAIVLINFLLFVYVAIRGSIYLVKKLWQKLFAPAAFSDGKLTLEAAFVLLLFVMPTLFLFIYDSDRNFYRSFFINFLIALVMAVVLSRKLEEHVPMYMKVYFGLCGVMVFISLVINVWWFKSNIDAGFEGPSISTMQDWKSINQDVTLLAKDCKIDLDNGKIVIDDMTYDSLKSSPNLYPITYLQLSAALMRLKPGSTIEAIHPNAILARCDSFYNAGIYFTNYRHRLCCLSLNPGKR